MRLENFNNITLCLFISLLSTLICFTRAWVYYLKIKNRRPRTFEKEKRIHTKYTDSIILGWLSLAIVIISFIILLFNNLSYGKGL